MFEIDDFKTRNSDRLDFTNVSRGTLQEMLQAAYEAGYRAAVGVRDVAGGFNDLDYNNPA
jgi:hypothetical protein